MSLFLTLAFNSLMYIALAGARLTFSLYALQVLRTSEWTVGLIMALFAVIAVPLAVPMGRLVDRIGVRMPMTCGVLTATAGIALAWRFHNVAALCLGSTLMGTGWVAIHLSLLKVIGDLSTAGNRLAYYNAYAVSFGIALLVGPPCAGFMIDLLGHRGTLLGLLGLIAVAGVVLAIDLKGMPRRRAEPVRAAAGGALQLLFDPQLRPIYVVGSLIGSAWELYTFVVPIHGHELGLSASQIGLILGAYSAATFVIRLVMPWLARRHREWAIMRGALFASAAGFAVLPFVTTAAVYMAVSFYMGLSLGSCLPNTLSLLHGHAPAGRDGEVLGIRVTITNVIQFTIPMMVGALGSAVGLGPVFWAFAAALGAGFGTAHRQARSEAD